MIVTAHSNTFVCQFVHNDNMKWKAIEIIGHWNTIEKKHRSFRSMKTHIQGEYLIKLLYTTIDHGFLHQYCEIECQCDRRDKIQQWELVLQQIEIVVVQTTDDIERRRCCHICMCCAWRCETPQSDLNTPMKTKNVDMRAIHSTHYYSFELNFTIAKKTKWNVRLYVCVRTTNNHNIRSQAMRTYSERQREPASLLQFGCRFWWWNDNKTLANRSSRIHWIMPILELENFRRKRPLSRLHIILSRLDALHSMTFDM